MANVRAPSIPTLRHALSLDPYTPEEQIAVGPSGKIYRGRGVATGQVVRIKALLGSHHIPCPVDRSVIEATLPFVLALEHPHIARLLDIDFDDDDFAIVSEFSPGLSGWDFMHQRQLTAADARAIATQMVMALQAGEQHQLHHGDIKLNNLYLAEQPGGGYMAQLQDWGLAACRKNQPEETLWFRAPERFSGDDATTQADLFSVATVLFTLMTGHTPVQGSTPEELQAAWQTFDPMPLRNHRPDIDTHFHDWLVWLLRYDPTMRPVSAQQALDMLQSAAVNYGFAPQPMMPAYVAVPTWQMPAPMMPVMPMQVAAPMPEPASSPSPPQPAAPRGPVRPASPKTATEPKPAAAPPRKRGLGPIIASLITLAMLIGAIVWMRSQWGTHWPDQLRRLITGKDGDDSPASVTVATWPPASLSSDGVMGQYVRVEIPGQATLNLAEIEVISLGTNIARAGRAASKDSAYGTTPGLVNDGNLSGDWSHKSIYHSKDHTDTPWVEIDLGSEQPIRAIRLWNRTDRDDFARRLTGYSVLIFSKDKSVRWRVDEQPTPDEPSVTFNVVPPH